MLTKCFEIRDRHTFIPVFGVKVSFENAAETYLLRQSGFQFPSNAVFLVKMTSGEGQYNPYGWGTSARTMNVAHAHIRDHWDELENGQVIDVEFILKESPAPKVSEKHSEPLTNKTL